MILSLEVKRQRYERVRSLLAEREVDVLISCGNDNVRFLAGPYWRPVGPEMVLFPREGEPSVLAVPPTRPVSFFYLMERIDQYLWIKNRKRITAETLLTGSGLSGANKGRIAVADLGFLPVDMHRLLLKTFPEADVFDGAEIMAEAKKLVTDEDIKVVQKAAEIADACYEEAIRATKVGVYNYEIIAAMEHTAKMFNYEGAPMSLNLVAVHPADPFNSLWHPVVPKKVDQGDSVIFEITPTYYGYTAQLTRQFSVGTPNAEIPDLCRICLKAQEAGVAALKTGAKASDVNRAMEDLIISAGYLPASATKTAPNGHPMGMFFWNPRTIANDIDDVLIAGQAFVLHPIAFVPGWKLGMPSFFGPGDTFVVTESGGKRLSGVSQEFRIL